MNSSFLIRKSSLMALLTAVSALVPVLTASAEESLVQARFVPERSDDFAWENDAVAFRVYGPALRSEPEDSGIDCWLKRVKYPIIDKWYKSGDYHTDHGEGVDPYHVGKSRGCGGIALRLPDGGYRTSDTYTAWRVIEKTPTRAVFELDYRYDGTDITETKRITIEAGRRLCQIESRFLDKGKPRVFEVGIGITTHDGAAEAKFDPKAGWMACWEKFPKDGELGTGVVVKDATFHVVKSPEKDASHVWADLKTDANGKVSWEMGYGWSKAGEITRFDQWTAYLAAAKP